MGGSPLEVLSSEVETFPALRKLTPETLLPGPAKDPKTIPDVPQHSLHYPHVNFEDVATLARKIPSIFMVYFKAECEHAFLECRWLSHSWKQIMTGHDDVCHNDVCLGMLPSTDVFDDTVATNPQLDFEDFFDKEKKPASWTTQWQQDWFVYHNFFNDNKKDGVYVDVGACWHEVFSFCL